MTGILLTQNGTPIIGDVAKLMGWIMNALFNFLDGVFGIQNIGLCIILFTIIIYLLMAAAYHQAAENSLNSLQR